MAGEPTFKEFKDQYLSKELFDQDVRANDAIASK